MSLGKGRKKLGINDDNDTDSESIEMVITGSMNYHYYYHHVLCTIRNVWMKGRNGIFCEYPFYMVSLLVIY